MRFAKWVLLIAGVYGVLVMTPMYFSLESFNREHPPAVTHPEFYYGFVGVTLVWQIVFLIASTNPLRFRPILLAAVVEKLSFAVPALLLVAQKRAPSMFIAPSAIDLILGGLFVAAYLKSK